ncbi:MAG: hypothetical protein MZU91_01490 [Desulfosudis oleivorans]|nr:hypothetical protein [Desulfosudis oleivorans]
MQRGWAVIDMKQDRKVICPYRPDSKNGQAGYGFIRPSQNSKQEIAIMQSNHKAFQVIACGMIGLWVCLILPRNFIFSK